MGDPSFDPEAFLSKVTEELAEAAPDEVKSAIVFEDALRGELLAFQADALAGLTSVVDRTGTSEQLEATLRARKTMIVSRAKVGVYTIERLVSSAISKIVERAREVSR